MAFAVLTSISQRADIPWLLIAIVTVWAIGSFGSLLRRLRGRARQLPQEAQAEATEVEQTPQGQRLTHTIQTIEAQAQASAVAAEQAMQARADAATAARMATARPSVAMGLGAAALDASRTRTVLLGDLVGTLSGMIDQNAPATTPLAPLAPETARPRIALFSGAGSLAAAIVAATVIGPPAGLRAEPIEPGGW